jgi:hypothetical protein
MGPWQPDVLGNWLLLPIAAGQASGPHLGFIYVTCFLRLATSTLIPRSLTPGPCQRPGP